MIKLLIVNTVPTSYNGITNVIFNLLQTMDISDMEVGYVSSSEIDTFYEHKLNEFGIRTLRLNRSIKNSIKYICMLSEVAKGYDIMHVHGNSATMLLEMIAAKIGGVAVRIAHGHSTSCSMTMTDKLMRPLFYWLCNARLACGEAAGRWLFNNRSFMVVNNGINVRKFRFNQQIRTQFRRMFQIDNEETVIGNIGNFVEAKNHTFLVKVFYEYHKTHNKSRLLLIGTGPLMKDIVKMSKELGLHDKIIFTGSVSNPQDYMQMMDAVIMTSVFEGLPLTLIEEQANGLPILASDVITTDADITGLVFFKSLEDGTVKWSSRLGEIVSSSERNTSISDRSIVKIQSVGYDINRVSQNLKDFYISRLNEHIV